MVASRRSLRTGHPKPSCVPLRRDGWGRAGGACGKGIQSRASYHCGQASTSVSAVIQQVAQHISLLCLRKGEQPCAVVARTARGLTNRSARRPATPVAVVGVVVLYCYNYYCGPRP